MDEGHEPENQHGGSMTMTFGEPTSNVAIKLALSEYKHSVTFDELVDKVTSDQTWKTNYYQHRMHTMAMRECMNQRIHRQRLYLDGHDERYNVLVDDFQAITAHLCNRFGYYTLPMVLQMLMENSYTLFLSAEYYPTFMRQENIDELTTKLKEVVCKHEQSVKEQLEQATLELKKRTIEHRPFIDMSVLDAAGYTTYANVPDVMITTSVGEDSIRRAREVLNLLAATQVDVTFTDTAPLSVTGDLWSSPIDGTSNNS